MVGEPVDIAYLAVYLASDEARFVTGQEITVDGGLTYLSIPPRADLRAQSQGSRYEGCRQKRSMPSFTSNTVPGPSSNSTYWRSTSVAAASP